MKSLKEVKIFDQLLDTKYGKKEAKSRLEFEERSANFLIGELLKQERQRAHLTQEEIALKTGTKKNYISRIERGKSDIQVSTLIRIFEKGFGKKLILKAV